MKLVSLDEYDLTAKQLHDLCAEIKATKRPVYTAGTADMFRNFRLGALACMDSPGHDLSHQLMKQVNSVVVLLTNTAIDDAEKATRFADLINYAELGYVMWKFGISSEKPGSNNG
jgi:hypothetical protein